MNLLRRDRSRLLLSASVAIVLHLGILVTVEYTLPEREVPASATIRVRLETRVREPAPEVAPEAAVSEAAVSEVAAESEAAAVPPPATDSVLVAAAPLPAPLPAPPPAATPTEDSPATPPADPLPTAIPVSAVNPAVPRREPSRREPPQQQPRESTAAAAPIPTTPAATPPAAARPAGAINDTVAAPPAIVPARYVEPRYPETARRSAIEGTVVVHFRVNQRGRVEDLQLRQSSGSDLLDREALRTVNLWRFARENAGRESVHRIVFRLEEN